MLTCPSVTGVGIFLAFLLNLTWLGLQVLGIDMGLSMGAREVELERISAEEFTRRLDGGETCAIIDVRSKQKYRLSPVRIRGAIRLAPAEVETRWRELPMDRLVVIYCDDYAEATSLRVAKALRDHGFSSVRVLRGGFNVWLRAGYPVETKD